LLPVLFPVVLFFNIFFLKEELELKKEFLVNLFTLTLVVSLFSYISYKLGSIGKTLDNFAITLNITNIFQILNKDDKGNLVGILNLYDSYYFLYKVYAIFILILIYQLIVSIRRRVKR